MKIEKYCVDDMSGETCVDYHEELCMAFDTPISISKLRTCPFISFVTKMVVK
jgi:hypothetical protein